MSGSSATATVVSVDGRRIRLTSLDKVLYPETGTTKADVIDYYARIAPVLLPHARVRPLTRKRWVDGVGTDAKPGTVFFQKNLDDTAPEWVERRTIEHSDHSTAYPVLGDRATLTWLGQIAALELHVPQWRFSRDGEQENPDRLVIDLDPGEGVGLAECAEVARAARAILSGMGLDPMPVTSGSKGIHLYAALDGSIDSRAVSAVARELARALEADHPDLVVSDMTKSLRTGKVLVDWSQNSAAKTTVTPYSLRGRSSPTVAAPRTWDELDSAQLAHLDFREVLERVAQNGDPLAPMSRGRVDSLEPSPARLDGFDATPASRDRLEIYRSKRDGSKTPEPVPTDAPHAGSGAGASFVIQEHHASRLHWDFRLEHDGVLVSWALPKGVPTDPGINHLAVQTEDHPLEYGVFEGTIPHGEYGGGDVTIWDSGTFELEKWREGKEVIATLHGEKHGTHRYALINTGSRSGSGSGKDSWLIHLMEPPGASSPKRSSATSPRTAGPKRTRTTVGSARSAATSDTAPMLATLATEADLDDDAEWAFEMKWDGIRSIATIVDGRVRLASRNGNDLTASYPELAILADAVDGDAVLDGEIVTFDERGRPDFGQLQSRMGVTRPKDVAAAAKHAPVHFIAFDVLSHDSSVVTALPWSERRALLDSVVTPGGAVLVSPAFVGDVAAAVATSLEQGLEGVMAKRLDGRYSPSRRSRAWLKIKHHRSLEVVVGGWRDGRGSRASTIGSLLVGVPTDDGLRYLGRVGTGLTERDLATLSTTFRAAARSTSPFIDVPASDASDAHWVTPRLVVEVHYAEMTASGRLRHATWRGIRSDKSPDDVASDATSLDLAGVSSPRDAEEG
ncbi:ATP-dependent DNA ligase [Marisediminicola sp. LYQ85]|uniref:ATP-dependent DNA ligase n=1 Tax=Marisediminicola sp. LYQ85 TaxID=3391062 RepID=UPI0039834306